MASVTARLLPPPVMAVIGGKPIYATVHKFKIPASRPRLDGIIAKAASESSETSSIVKSVQNVWDKSEDRIALIGLGFSGIVALWASINLVTVIDKLPVVPSVFEFIGLLFSAWFTYRYLLYKPNREELSVAISKSLSDILG